MSCTVSQGVVLCQLGYWGAGIALFAFGLTVSTAYLLGRLRALRERLREVSPA